MSKEREEDGLASALGPVYDRVIENADIYLAGVDDLLVQGVGVTVREAAGISGWVGVVNADLTPFREFKLELRLPRQTAACGVMFTVGGEVFKRTLIRGTGPMPGESRKVRSRPRIMPTPPELR